MSHLYLDESLDLLGLAPGAIVELSGDEARHAVTVARVRVGRARLDRRRPRACSCAARSPRRGRSGSRSRPTRCVVDERPSPQLIARAGAREGRPRRARGAGGDRARASTRSCRGRPRARSRAGRAPKAEKGRERWAAIVREAAKQSIRAWLPRSGRWRRPPSCPIAWQACGCSCSSRPPRRRSTDLEPDGRDLALVVGPEGGIAPAELERLIAAGAEAGAARGIRAAHLDGGPRGDRRAERAARAVVRHPSLRWWNDLIHAPSRPSSSASPRARSPRDIVAETDRVIAFHDIAPKAPVHVVVTTKTGEYRDVVELAAGDPALLAELVAVARSVASELADGQFRLVFNTGEGAGQTDLPRARARARRAVSRRQRLPEPEQLGPSSESADVDEERLSIDGIAMVRLLGPQDRLLTSIEHEYPGVEVHVRGNEIAIRGDAESRLRVRRLIEELLELVRSGQDPTPTEVRSSARMLDADPNAKPSELLGQVIVSSRGKTIRPKTLGQRAYVDAIDENTIVFGIGPAGTGKTYLAMAKAVQALQRKEVEPHHPDAARPSRRASGSGSCPARSPTRSTRTCGRSTTRSTR